jgi:putative endonuclease
MISPVTDPRRRFGNHGEDLAVVFFMQKGFRIIERNWLCRLGEIDLIMTKDRTIVFVEVKLKIGEDWGTPEEMLNAGKLARVERVANAFLVINPKYKELARRIEAVCIVLNQDKTINRISHYDQF